jgi:hypothetical protein
VAQGLLQDVLDEMELVFGDMNWVGATGSSRPTRGAAITQVQRSTLVVVVFYIVAQIYKVFKRVFFFWLCLALGA